MSEASKYLRFMREPDAPSGKTQVWSVRSIHGGYLLGTVRWFGRWRQYAFSPSEATTFNPVCLQEIAEFTAQLTAKHRQALRA